MEVTLEDNAVLKTLQNLFKENCPKDEETMSKLSVIKLFFDYKIIDSCGYNIFELNDLSQILHDQFLLLIK